MKSGARNAPRRQRGVEEALEEAKGPRVHVDYSFMSKEDENKSKNLLIVMAGERVGSRYARAVGREKLWEDGSMDWLVEDISSTLKSWGYAGGEGR